MGYEIKHQGTLGFLYTVIALLLGIFFGLFLIIGANIYGSELGIFGLLLILGVILLIVGTFYYVKDYIRGEIPTKLQINEDGLVITYKNHKVERIPYPKIQKAYIQSRKGLYAVGLVCLNPVKGIGLNMGHDEETAKNIVNEINLRIQMHKPK